MRWGWAGEEGYGGLRWGWTGEDGYGIELGLDWGGGLWGLRWVGLGRRVNGLSWEVGVGLGRLG